MGGKKVQIAVMESLEEEKYYSEIFARGDRKWKDNKGGQRKGGNQRRGKW